MNHPKSPWKLQQTWTQIRYKKWASEQRIRHMKTCKTMVNPYKYHDLAVELGLFMPLLCFGVACFPTVWIQNHRVFRVSLDLCLSPPPWSSLSWETSRMSCCLVFISTGVISQDCQLVFCFLKRFYALGVHKLWNLLLAGKYYKDICPRRILREIDLNVEMKLQVLYKRSAGLLDVWIFVLNIKYTAGPNYRLQIVCQNILNSIYQIPVMESYGLHIMCKKCVWMWSLCLLVCQWLFANSCVSNTSCLGCNSYYKAKLENGIKCLFLLDILSILS